MNQNILKAIITTAHITGSELPDDAYKVMLSDLSEYTEQQVLSALVRVRKECKGRLTLASIIERIDTGWISADEAWGEFPKEEHESGCITDQMANAWGVASSLYEMGDKVAARMAFKAAYEREVAKAKEAGLKPRWYVSGGSDVHLREQAASEALRKGRIGVESAINHMLPDMRAKVLIEHGRDDMLMLGSKAPKLTDEEKALCAGYSHVRSLEAMKREVNNMLTRKKNE